MTRSSYKGRTVGENIAWRLGAVRLARRHLRVLMNSSGHKANILTSEFGNIGVGAVSDTHKDHVEATRWSANFGAR